MDRMSQIFAADYMNDFFDEVQKISELLPKVTDHFQQFQGFLENSAQSDPAKVSDFIQQVHTVRRKLNHNLISLAKRSEDLAAQIFSLNQRGECIGPVFDANPVLFLTRAAPMYLPPRSGLVGVTPEQAVQEIESIKQKRSVAQGAEPIFLLFLNAIQSLRKMEKGMAECLAQRFQVDSGFRFFSKVPMDEEEEKDVFSILNVQEDPYVQKISACLTCPLSRNLFKNPVLLETGYSFERSFIESYLKNNDTCPVTKKKLSSKELIPNLALKSIAQRFQTCQNKATFAQQLPETESCVSLEPFKEPEVVSSGATYEKSEVDTLFAQGRDCYVTSIKLNPNIRIPNLALLELMRLFEPNQLQSLGT